MKRLWIRLIAFSKLHGTTVLILDGRAVAKRGKVRGILLAELGELAQAQNINAACLHVVTASGAGTANFKLLLYGVPAPLHQRFRNVWSVNWR